MLRFKKKEATEASRIIKGNSEKIMLKANAPAHWVPSISENLLAADHSIAPVVPIFKPGHVEVMRFSFMRVNLHPCGDFDDLEARSQDDAKDEVALAGFISIFPCP